MKTKVLVSSVTKTKFGIVVNNVSEYDYNRSFGTYLTSRQMAAFLLELYEGEKTVRLLDGESLCF